MKKPKFNVFVFYGPFAVGKYTVAKEFQKATGFKFIHNHQTYDIAKGLFDRGSIHIDRLCETLRIEIIKEIARAKINTVMTHAYSSDFVSKTGLSDIDFVKNIERTINKAGGTVYFILLKTNKKELIKRVSGASRFKFKKLTDESIMKKIIKEKGNAWFIPAKVKNNIEIDNTNLSPKQVVKKILDMNLI